MTTSRRTVWSLLLVPILGLATLALATRGADVSTRQTEGLRRNPPDVVALEGLRIVVRPGQVIDNATVLIRSRKIVDVGTDVEVPPGAEVIDLSGKTAYAGLIDGYAEQSVSTRDINQGSPYWNPNVRPQLNVGEQLSRSAETDRKLRSQGVAARLVAPQGGVFCGTSALVLVSDDDPMTRIVRSPVAMHGRLTVTRGETSRDEYPNSPMGAVALARQAMYDAAWHRQAQQAAKVDTFLPVIERNDALDALQPVADGTLPLVIETSNELMALRADRFARELGLDLIVKGSGNEYRRLDEIAALKRPILVPVDFPKPPNVGSESAAAKVSLESLMHWDHAPENPGRLVDAGVRIVLTSHGLDDVNQFLKSVRKAVGRGLKKDAALAALTTTPAELFGAADLLGTVEAGKLACLTIADGDLFDSKTKIVETWVAGERFQIVPDEVRKIEGDWQLTLEWPEGKGKSRPRELLLEVKSGNKLSAKVRPAETLPEFEKAVSLKTVTMHDTLLSGTFKAESFGEEGTARFTVVVEKEPPSRGSLLWPDGTRANLRMRKNPGQSQADADDDASADTPQQEETADDTADDTEEDDEDSGDEKTSDEKKNERTRPGEPASFPVNYPLGAYGRSDPPQQPELVAVTNATIWTSGPEGRIENATLLIENGIIKAVGQDVDVPDDAEVIDGSGKHVTAGIIDCHSHIATDGGVNESSQAITSEVRVGDFVDCDDIDIYRQLAGGVTTSNILHGSANPIGGQNQILKFRWGALGEEMKFREAPPGIKFALGENVKQSNWGDRYTTRYPQTRMGVEQLFRDAFQAAREYARRHEEWEQQREGIPPRRDLELEALVEVLDQERWIHCHSYRQDEILALIRVLDEFGIRIGTFQHILEGYKVADAMRAHGAMGSSFSDWWAYKFEVFDAIPYAGAIMHDQGVIVSFNSDDAELARHLNQEAAKAVKYGGVDPQEALKFVTLNPAKQLRIDEFVGSLEPGKHADFVLWSGPPLSNLSRCEQTWIDGRKYFDREEDAAAQKKVDEMRNELIQKILKSGEEMRPEGEGDDDPQALWPRADLFCLAHDHDHDGHDGHEHHGHEHEEEHHEGESHE